MILLPFLGFVINGALGYLAPDRRRLVSVVGPGVLGLAFLIAAVNFVLIARVHDAEPVIRSYWTWIEVGQLRVDAALQIDQLAMAMALVVTCVSFIIHVYSIGYMGEDRGYARYFAYLNLFVFFMLVLVLGASFPLMFVGWEGVGLCSYLLIGFWFKQSAKADAGQKAFIVNRIGDFGFLIAMFLMFAYLGTLDFQGVFETAPGALEYGGAAVTLITLFLFLGCTGKSAQIPLYVWLPDAMHGPTPVSALIHAATMVTAGVYLVARAGVLFALAPLSMNVVATVGGVTALFAATIAVQQFDIKRVIAYSTISQLGYMFLAVGVGAYTAGIFHLGTHAFFKALLFLASGAVIHSMHHALEHAGEPAGEDVTQDLRNMGGLKAYMPGTFRTAWVGALALAGVFPLAGFFSKDEIIWSAGARGQTVLWVVAIITALLTAGYITRWLVMAFHGVNRTGDKARKYVHEAGAVMVGALVVLAVGSAVTGWVNIPEALPLLPEFSWLHQFLHPSFEAAEHIIVEHLGEPAHASPIGGGEGLWSVLATAAAVAVIVVVFQALKGKKYLPARESKEPAGVWGLLYHKYYVDELYDLVVVRPFKNLCVFSWRVIDQGLIDGVMVNGVAYTTRFGGWVVSRFQTGYLGTYVLIIVLGVLIILGAVAL
ncbi:MAG: NADH-quinone oxidoreductase subunit L [Gemmatimonadota bacterium]|nr:MAG: NADH-quinone oxidoreductase subunit L [Gemmatimonadota bacterium]